MNDLDRVVERLPHRFPGPGGACAVLRRGEVIAQNAWGWANAERRIPFTSKTLIRMCSVTKQFTCALVMDAFPDPSVLDADVQARLPNLPRAPAALTLCHNQSGLRDYWALAMLHGALATSPFGETEAARVIDRARTLQFAPGTRYAYCNQNFRILSDLLQDRTGRSFAELLRTRVFDRVGMGSALLVADTRAMPDGTEGYEGSQAAGFRVAENNLLWTGDAGLGASLDDMIAWERHIDATHTDPDSLYGRIAAPVFFADGAPATYGFGLGRSTERGLGIISHGGALRGWRSHRLHVATERVSVVVLFNHLAEAHVAATELLAATLGTPPKAPSGTAAMPAWQGAFLEPETGLAVRIRAASPTRVYLHYDRHPDVLDIQEDGTAGTDGPQLRHGDGGLWMHRPDENQSTCLQPIDPAPARLDVAGRFHCTELDAQLTVVDAGGALYGSFSGFLGQGRMELLEHIAADVWALPCPRSLDHTPPGDWTLAFRRDAGRITGVTVGCWLARRLDYVALSPRAAPVG